MNLSAEKKIMDMENRLVVAGVGGGGEGGGSGIDWEFCFFVFCYFRALPAAYGVSQARGPIRTTAASLHHSHSNMGSETCL